MKRALGLAVLTVGITLSGLVTGTASAAATCSDVHWIGAAGSGQRDGAGLTTNGGMGAVVYQSYRQLSANLAMTGQTITAEAVEYPAVPVPPDGGLGGWMGFMDSVKAGAKATAQQVAAYTALCPSSMVVLAGYSQGAMAIHRNLADLATDPHVVAALLIADGDRLPGDTTINMGSTATVPTKGMGVAQDHSFLASAPTSKLPVAMGAKTVSVCDVGDPVCDYDPAKGGNVDDVSAAAIAIHTSYAPTTSGVHAWGVPIARLVLAAAPSTSTPIGGALNTSSSSNAPSSNAPLTPGTPPYLSTPPYLNAPSTSSTPPYLTAPSYLNTPSTASTPPTLNAPSSVNASSLG